MNGKQYKRLRKIRACNMTTAQVVLEFMIKEAVDAEREACAQACEEDIIFDPDDPGVWYAALLRSRGTVEK